MQNSNLDMATCELSDSEHGYAYFFIREVTEKKLFTYEQARNIWAEIVDSRNLDELRIILKRYNFKEYEAINPDDIQSIDSRLSSAKAYSHFLKDGFSLIPVGHYSIINFEDGSVRYLFYIPVRRI